MIVTALGVMVVFQAARWVFGRLAQQEGTLGTIGRAGGGLFSFPAQ